MNAARRPRQEGRLVTSRTDHEKGTPMATSTIQPKDTDLARAAADRAAATVSWAVAARLREAADTIACGPDRAVRWAADALRLRTASAARDGCQPTLPGVLWAAPAGGAS